jgi:hypothetical protein
MPCEGSVDHVYVVDARFRVCDPPAGDTPVGQAVGRDVVDLRRFL